MLAKILEEMWVEPELLEALSEEQKRILFFKMREEQVRRWKEREEREEREGRNAKAARPKKGYSKHVTWLLGRDGDVRVSVIGELDEFRSSRILQNLMNTRVHADNMNGIQTAKALPAREAQQIHLKEDVQLSLTDVSDEPPDDPEDPEQDSHSESGSSLDSQEDWPPVYRPHFGSHGNQLPLKGQHLSDTVEARQADRGGVGVVESRPGRVGGLVVLQACSRDLHSALAGAGTHL